MDKLYINIGTEKGCLFVRMSHRFLTVLQQKPLLYFAVEEALHSAKCGYYGIGILAFSQILNALSKKTPATRHKVAHELLQHRPTRLDFESALAAVKKAAFEQGERELAKSKDKDAYRRSVLEEWYAVIRALHHEPEP